MSGVSGSDRITRKNFDKVLKDYENEILKNIPGFKSVEISGSYNSDKSKMDFGDMDLIVHIETDMDKPTLKKSLADYFNSLPDNVTVPFTSPKYKGKKYYNSGEIVTINYPQPDGTVQIDNIIALDYAELKFKKEFLDMPAEKQGLVLGLIKIAIMETDAETLIKKMEIKVPKINDNEKFEFNLSSVELQLRAIVEQSVGGKIKQTSKRTIWASKDWSFVEKILYNYDLDVSFEDLVQQAEKKVKDKRGLSRIVGVFKSMISVKSGEVGTPKGVNKEKAIVRIEQILERKSNMIRFKNFLSEAMYRDLEINTIEPEELGDELYRGKENILYYNYDKRLIQVTDMNNTLLFSMNSFLNTSKKKFTLGKRNNISQSKKMTYKTIFTLLKLGYSVRDDYQHNSLSVKVLRNIIEDGYIDIIYNGKIIDNIDEIFDDQIIGFEYIIKNRNDKMMLENVQVTDTYWKDGCLFEESNDLVEMLNLSENKDTVGLFVGRFQPLTKAHTDIIETISKENDKGIIFLVKAKKQDLEKSPFNEDIQRKLLNEIIPRNIVIVTLPSGYFIDYINNLSNNIFTIYAGTDRVNSYDRLKQYMAEGKTLNAKEIKRSDEDISATKVRNALKSGDVKTFEKLTDSRIHKYYEELRGILI